MIGEITDKVEAIDHGMQWGYNWEFGPFETWDAIGGTTALYESFQACVVELAVWSHEKAIAATKAGKFEDEIVPVHGERFNEKRRAEARRFSVP